MGRKSKFEDDEILAAAQQIIAQEKEVTGYTLTVQLGGGKASHLEDRYRALSEATAKTDQLPSLPPVIETAVNNSVSNLAQHLIATLTKTYSELKVDAEVRVEDVKKAAHEQVQKVRTQLDKAMDDWMNAEDRCTDLQARLTTAEGRIGTLISDIANRDGQITALNDAKNDLTKTIHDLQSDQHALENEKSSLTKQLTDAQAAVVKAKAEAEKSIQDAKAEATKAVQDAKDEALQERKLKDAALLRATASESAYNELKSNNDKATSDLAEANKTIGQLEGQLKAAATQLEAKTNELEAIKARPVQIQEEVATKKH